MPPVETWTPKDVQKWACNIDGNQENVATIFLNNSIKLLVMNMDGLKIMGVERPGTMCLSMKGIEKLITPNLCT